MKHSGTYALIVAIACLFGVYYFSKSKPNASVKNSVFKVSDISSIHRIDIKSKRIEDMSIRRDKSTWSLQRGHKVRDNALANVIEVLENIEIKYIPQKSAINNITQEISEIGIEVNLYDEKNNLIRAFVVGGSTADERGTYMILANSDQPYIMHLPGLEGSVRGRFLHSYDNWRDRTILREDPASIRELELNYHRQSSESFKLLDKSITQLATGKQVDASIKSDAYLLGFEELVAEAYENANSNKDSIRTLLPFVTISIKDDSDIEKWLKLYPIENFVGENLVGLDDTKRINRYFVDTSWGDFALVQQRLVGKLLRGYSYFANHD